jgi:hypothetical protein
VTCRRRPLGLLLAVALAAVASLLSAGTLRAQSSEEILAQRRLEYRAAQDAYQSAQSAFNVVEQQFSAALREIDRAKRSGDDGALQRAYALAQERAVPKADRARRVAEVAAALEEARDRLIEILVVRQQELVAQAESAPTTARRQELDILLRDVSAELSSVEAEAEKGDAVGGVAMPDIRFDPRDGPADFQQKAEILERTAAVVDTLIQDTDARIEALDERLRIERNRRDFLAGTDRFDDRRLPVVTGPPGDPTVQSADSTVVNGRPLTLEERIESAREYRETLVEYRDQLLIRAEQFRRRLRSVT